MPDSTARRLTLAGHVQGVGFRPFVYRLAQSLGIRGWVMNATGRVEIHAEGGEAALTAFASGLIQQAPPLARPRIVAEAPAEPGGATDFRIVESEAATEADIHLPADGFVCADCLRELADPADRRHRYAFINCTQCGPRYTLITALPYDRANTAMAGFALCPECRMEYEAPADRRFHAEPVACPKCGPHLAFVDLDSGPCALQGIRGDDEMALAAAVAALKAGQVVAVKGIGGYHLLCDAANAEAVQRLRARKRRPGKPLAVMFPPDEQALGEWVVADAAALALLRSSARPIVLLPRREGLTLAPGIAPGLHEIGCLLPYSPLHHLLIEGFGGPLVATSGNVSGEPVLTDAAEAEARLANVADAFLHHDRPIVRPADDPVLRPIAGRARPIRLGRGLAPLELTLPRPLPHPVLALGAHSKNAIALAWGDRVVISPHIGELGSARSQDTLARVAADLQALYQVRAEAVLLDRHRGYGYRRYAEGLGLPLHAIWHHQAHASALAGEHPEVARWITFAWDGVGLGEDGSLWGGEAFVGRPGGWRRAASWRPFRLPGGEQAGREPWRSAAALLWEVGTDKSDLPPSLTPALSRGERGQIVLLRQAWEQGLNSPATTAVGRLFDAAAALTGLCVQASFEGEGPMRLEAAADPHADALPLPLHLDTEGLWRTDWAPLLRCLMDESLGLGARAGLFHASLAQALVEQAQALRAEHGIEDVGLTGGVFQNRLLTELALARLQAAGFRVHLAEQVPMNDAGIAFGQVVEWG